MPKKPTGPPGKSSLTWQVHDAYRFDYRCDHTGERHVIEPAGRVVREYVLNDQNLSAEALSVFASIVDEQSARAWLATFGLPLRGCTFDELLLMGRYVRWLNALLHAAIKRNHTVLQSCLDLHKDSTVLTTIDEIVLRKRLSNQQTKSFEERRRLKDLENERSLRDQFMVSFKPPADSIYWWSEVSPGKTDGINQDWWLSNALLFTQAQWSAMDLYDVARWYVALATEEGTRGMGLSTEWATDPKTRQRFLKPVIKPYCPWHVVNHELFKLAISESDLGVCLNCAKVFSIRDIRMKFCTDQCTKQDAYKKSKAKKQKGQ